MEEQEFPKYAAVFMMIESVWNNMDSESQEVLARARYNAMALQHGDVLADTFTYEVFHGGLPAEYGGTSLPGLVAIRGTAVVVPSEEEWAKLFEPKDLDL